MELDWTAIIVCLLGGGGLIANLINAVRERRAMSDKNIKSRLAEMDQKLLNDYRRMDRIEKNIASLTHTVEVSQDVMERGVEGIMLGLENDQVIFNAFRQNRINGESERQDEKMQKYFAQCTRESFNVK